MKRTRKNFLKLTAHMIAIQNIGWRFIYCGLLTFDEDFYRTGPPIR